MKPNSLADICRSHGLTLADLARASGVSLPSVKQLEQNPPRKKNTWIAWQRRITRWIPLLGHAFPDVLENQAFVRCPHEVSEDLLAAYNQWAISEATESREISIRELEFLSNADELDAEGDWNKAEIWVSRAARLFPRHDSRWAYHHFAIAQLRVNKGELDSAERLIDKTIVRHTSALEQAGKTWEPSSLALARSTRAWSHFLKGDWQLSQDGFDETIILARRSDDHDLVNRGLHMSARALAEPYIMRAYYSENSENRRLNTRIVEESISRLQASMAFDNIGSPRHAFGLWYEGVLIGLSGDVIEGKRLVERAESQLRTNAAIIAALSHAGLSRLHFNILSTAWDSGTFRRCETELRDMLPALAVEKYPYAYADTLITLAYCRIQQSNLLTKQIETADLLYLALIIHPYPQHELWKAGKYLLTEIVLPSFSDDELMVYQSGLRDRINNGENHFAYLQHWQFDLSPLEKLLNTG